MILDTTFLSALLSVIDLGRRMGEADTLIAGIALYNSQPLVSNDRGFDRVPGLRRIAH